MEKLTKKCHICGATDEIDVCGVCGKPVCWDNDKCGEQLNNGEVVWCTECIDKATKHDCEECVQQDCPLDREYSYAYNCDEYVAEIQPGKLIKGDVVDIILSLGEGIKLRCIVGAEVEDDYVALMSELGDRYIYWFKTKEWNSKEKITIIEWIYEEDT